MKVSIKIKKVLPVIFSIIFVLCLSSMAPAYTWDRDNDPNPNVAITNDNNVPDPSNWYQLPLPSWYNHNYVSAFTIDMYGNGDDSGNAIDIWRKLGDSSATEAKIVGFDVVNNSRAFILRMNLMDGHLYRNYWYWTGTQYQWSGFVDTTKNLENITLSNFDVLAGQSFLIGYACHFNLDKTTIHIEQQQVPEPATMLLLGLGLIGLAGVRRFKK